MLLRSDDMSRARVRRRLLAAGRYYARNTRTVGGYEHATSGPGGFGRMRRWWYRPTIQPPSFGWRPSVTSCADSRRRCLSLNCLISVRKVVFVDES